MLPGRTGLNVQFGGWQAAEPAARALGLISSVMRRSSGVTGSSITKGPVVPALICYIVTLVNPMEEFCRICRATERTRGYRFRRYRN